MEKVSQKLVVKNKLGMHARPAALFVEIANKFDSDIFVSNAGRRVNGKSIMSIMMLAAAYNTKLLIEIEGPDAKEAMQKIEELFKNNFYE